MTEFLDRKEMVIKLARIMIDPGHGHPDNRGGVLGLNEGTNNFEVSQDVIRELRKYGHTVHTTRHSLRDDPSLQARSNAGAGYDLFLSIHSNAVNGRVSGAENYDSTEKPNYKLASMLCEAIAKAQGITNRGVRYRGLANGWDVTYRPRPYTKNYYAVLRDNKATSSMLLEMFYHDNPNDVRAFRANRSKVIQAIVSTINTYYGVRGATPIMGQPTTTVRQMQAYAKAKKANQTFIALAPKFYEIAVKRGVDPAVVYAQVGKETNFMNYGGVLDISYKNPGAIKTTGGGGNYDPHAHTKFKTWEDGILAQVDHLGLYAGIYYGKNTTDPRHFKSIQGTAKTVEELGGRWAPASNYGTDIVNRMRDIYKFDGGIEKVIPSNFDSVISFKPYAQEFAIDLSRKLKVPAMIDHVEAPMNYHGLKRVICVGDETDIQSFTGYMTHFINARDNWSSQRNLNFLESAETNVDRFKKTNPRIIK